MSKRSANSAAAILAVFVLAGVWNGAPIVANAAAQRPGEPQRSRYRDGTYTATGQYGGQPSFITVTVDLKAGVVTAVTVRPHAIVPRSLELQRAFARAVPAVVVGKPIDKINVGKLAGSSGTPKGFNAAIRQIRDQADARSQ